MPKKREQVRLSAAAVELAQAIEKEGLGVNGASAEIKSPAGMMSRWLRGERMPSVRWAARIEERFGVLIRNWTVEAARARRKEAA